MPPALPRRPELEGQLETLPEPNLPINIGPIARKYLVN